MDKIFLIYILEKKEEPVCGSFVSTEIWEPQTQRKKSKMSKQSKKSLWTSLDANG